MIPMKPVLPEYLLIVTRGDAKAYYRPDCPTCVLIMALAKEKKWRVMVNTESRDCVAVLP